MAKFLNKKERVIDFQLTPLGREKLAGGRFKPAFYQFFDDGIVYDSEYVGFTEEQNSIHERIKNETQFIEGILSFTDIESFGTVGGYDVTKHSLSDGADEDIAVAPLDRGDIPLRTNKLTFDSAISDVVFDSENMSYAPATKIVTCQGQITNIVTKDDSDYDTNFDEDLIDTSKQDISMREYNIPQIDIGLYYTKEVGPPKSILDSNDIQGVIQQTSPFVDNNVIRLVKNDLVIYAEELNTELLTENFDVEVFEIIEETKVKKLVQKFFRNVDNQIVDGFMTSQNEKKNLTQNYIESSVEYFFDVLTDSDISAKIVCGCASSFNKDSYYVDIDHDCEKLDSTESLYFDIYGSVTVPEICAPGDAQNNVYDNQLTPDLEQKDSIESCED